MSHCGAADSLDLRNYKTLHLQVFSALFGVPEIVLSLLVQPAFRRSIKGYRQAMGTTTRRRSRSSRL